jgi:hypothetical protein
MIGFALSMCRDAAHSMVTVFGMSPVTMAWMPAIILFLAVAALSRIVSPWRQRGREARALPAV